MKNITTILLIILALGCNAQEPRLMYTVEYVDSVSNLLSTERLKNDSLNSLLSKRLFADIIEIDTIDLLIYDENILISIKKNDINIWLSIVQDTNRYHLWYLPEFDKIEAREANGSFQQNTWDIKNSKFYY